MGIIMYWATCDLLVVQICSTAARREPGARLTRDLAAIVAHHVASTAAITTPPLPSRHGDMEFWGLEHLLCVRAHLMGCAIACFVGSLADSGQLYYLRMAYTLAQSTSWHLAFFQ